MGNIVIESVKPVRFGILLGLFAVLFGISWAFWLVLGHERIHQSLEQRAAYVEKAMEARMLRDSTRQIEAPKAKVHTHKDGSLHEHGSAEVMAMAQPAEPGHHEIKGGHEHDNPIMATAHTRLVRGHLHAMGLGLAAILISIVLAFTTASGRVKAIASVLTGLGAVIYPFAWIVMGYNTPSLGPEAAEASVVFIAGPSVGLVLLGVFTAIGYTLRDIFRRS